MFKKKKGQENPEWEDSSWAPEEEIPEEEQEEFLTQRPEDALDAYSDEEEDLSFFDDGEDEVEMRDYHPIRFRRDGKTGCLGGLMYGVFVISVSIILACVGWMFASDVLALNKPEVTASVTIPEEAFSEKEVEVTDEEGNVVGTETVQSADIDYVATALKDAGLIEYKFLFKLFSLISDADVKIDPGTYELDTSLDYRALITKMQIGSESQVETTVTFPEGFTMYQIFQRLEENNICSVEDLYDAAANYDYSYSFLDDIPLGDASRLEGFLFPDTYNFYEGMSATAAIDVFLLNFHNKLTADMLEQAEAMGMTLREVVTVASMIEKEAANDDERALIASVIYNRLAIDMPLQIDATSLYTHPDHEGEPTQEMLDDASDPYNTRINTGLPPTPIASPGAASLTAAFQPASTSYYYYALDTETNTHQFFTNSTDFENFLATQNY